MEVELVLLRHGIAEEYSKEGLDFTRKLTEKGKRRLEKRLPHLKKLLRNQKHQRIISSPLVRARETAKILKDVLGIETDIGYYDFLGEGNLEAFLSYLETLRQEETLFVVGHEPYLSQWAEFFTKEPLVFRKGQAASFLLRIEEETIMESRLLWSYRPREMKKIGKKMEKKK